MLHTTTSYSAGSINEIKNSIPTKTSQLQNDSGYLTEHQDLSDYATKSELHNHDNKNILDTITQEKIDDWDNKSEFSGSYNDLTDKPIIPTIPDIPTKVSQLENDSNYATESFVTDKIIEACKKFTKLAPLHNPAMLACIEAAKEAFPGTPMVAVFDTSFHQTMEPARFLYPVPYEWYQKYGVRRWRKINV